MKLKEIRLRNKLSIPALSQLSNVPIRTIEDIERRNDCRLSTAVKLAKALNITINDFIEKETED